MDDCTKAAPLLAVAALAPLEPADHAFVQSHLARCTRCTGALAASLCDDVPDVPLTPWRTAMPQPSIAIPRYVWPAVGAAALAAVVLLTFLALRRDDAAPTATPTIAVQARAACPNPKQNAFARWCEDTSGRKDGAYDVFADGVHRQHREYRAGRPHGTWKLFGESEDSGYSDLVAQFVDGRLVSVLGETVKPDVAVADGLKLELIFNLKEKDLASHERSLRLLTAHGDRERVSAAVRSVKTRVFACADLLAKHETLTVKAHLRITRTGQVDEVKAFVDDRHRAFGACIEEALRQAKASPGLTDAVAVYPFVF